MIKEGICSYCLVELCENPCPQRAVDLVIIICDLGEQFRLCQVVHKAVGFAYAGIIFDEVEIVPDKREVQCGGIYNHTKRDDYQGV